MDRPRGPRADGRPGLEVVVAGTVATPVEASPVDGCTSRGRRRADAVQRDDASDGPRRLAGGARVRSCASRSISSTTAAPPGGISLRRGGVNFAVLFRADQPFPAVDLALGLPGLNASLLPELLASIIPRSDCRSRRADRHGSEVGLVLHGDASLDVPFPGTGGIGPLDVQALGVRVGVGTEGGGPQLPLGVRADVAMELPAAPVTLARRPARCRGRTRLTSGAPPVISTPALGGVGVSIDLLIVSGGGVSCTRGRVAGAMRSPRVPPLAVAVFACSGRRPTGSRSRSSS